MESKRGKRNGGGEVERKRGRGYSEDDIIYLRYYCRYYDDKQLGDVLGRSERAIREVRCKFKITRIVHLNPIFERPDIRGLIKEVNCLSLYKITKKTMASLERNCVQDRIRVVLDKIKELMYGEEKEVITG